MVDEIKSPKSNLRNNIAIAFFLVIVLWGISMTRIFQYLLYTALVREEVDKIIIENIARNFTTLSTGVTIIGLVIVLFVAILFSRAITAPINKLIEAVTAVTRGKQDVKVDVVSEDETGYLSWAFNQMIEVRQEFEKTLAEEKELLAVTLHSIGDAVITTDTKGKIFLINKVAEKLTGFRYEAAVGRNLDEVVQIINEKTRKRCLNPVAKILESGEIVGLANHAVLVAKDGSERIIADSGVPIRDKKGNIIGVVLVFRDITEKKRAEEKLREYSENLEQKVVERTRKLEEETKKLQKSETTLRYLLEDVNDARLRLEKANEKLKELDRLKSMFIASMSHELRTPLNSIIGFTGIILQRISGEITEEQEKQLTIVKNSGKHLLELINDVIDMSRIETKKIELSIEEFEISALVREIMDAFKSAIDKKGLEICLDILDIPKGLIITSDEQRAKQIIMNLISNAVKFTDKGRIEIKVAKKENKMKVLVKDTGIGIKEEDMGKLFKAFSRIPHEGRPMQEGTGLGLYLSQKLGALIGGDIKAESKFNRGSVFTLILPLRYKKGK